MIHNYQDLDAFKCIGRRDVLFIGDSVTRRLFYQFAHILDPVLPTEPLDPSQKHSDYVLHTARGTKIFFYWDPFLNTTHTHHIISRGLGNTPANQNHSLPSLLVLGSGLWNLRYAAQSGGILAWEANMENIINNLTTAAFGAADQTIVLPVEQVISSKLSRDRAATMHLADIDAMNSDLYHRISTLSSLVERSGVAPSAISFASVLNQMLHTSETEDGLHFSDGVVSKQANILLNLKCNNILSQTFPWDKTCCRQYSWPGLIQSLLLLSFLGFGPLVWFLYFRKDLFFFLLLAVADTLSKALLETNLPC
jgi:N-acetylneuraminate 9-O-acetyltransferase